MSRFYVGQKVVCLKTGPWECVDTLSDAYGPIRNEILTVRKIEHGKYNDNETYLGFNHYQPHTYLSAHFRPLEECDQSEDMTRELATQLLERIVHEELDIIPNKQHAAQ